MSVYATAQPQVTPQGLQESSPWGQQFAPQQSYGPQQPYGYGQQTPQHQIPWQSPFGQLPLLSPGYLQPQPVQGTGPQTQLPQIVTELAMRCATSAVAAVVEQLRFEPQALTGIQAQGQIPPHLWSNVLVECARRVAPVLHTALAPIVQGQIPQGQIPPGALPGQFPGQSFGMPQQTQQTQQSYGIPQQGAQTQPPYGVPQMPQPFGQFGFSPWSGAAI